MKKWMSLVVAGCLCLGMIPTMPRETVLAAEGGDKLGCRKL